MCAISTMAVVTLRWMTATVIASASARTSPRRKFVAQPAKNAAAVSKSAEDTMLYMLIGHFRRGAVPAGAASPTLPHHSDIAGVTLVGSWVEATLGRSFQV